MYSVIFAWNKIIQKLPYVPALKMIGNNINLDNIICLSVIFLRGIKLIT